MREEVRTHRRLAELATRQHGVVSARQLRSLGYSSSAIGRAVAARSLHRVHRSVYAVGHRRLTDHGRCLAAVMACGRDALLSHASAAWLWGIARSCPAPAEVAIPRRGKARAAFRVHHAPALRNEDGTAHEGVPVTTVPRTLLDLASVVPPSRLARAMERSEQLRLLDIGELDSLLARSRGHPGNGPLREGLDAYREPAFTRSGLERRFLALVRETGLPTPSANLFVAGHEVDMYWERERFAVELDGYEYHRSRAAFERDRLRQEELKLAGIEMIRLTAHRVGREPEAIAKRLAALLERRRELSPPPGDAGP